MYFFILDSYSFQLTNKGTVQLSYNWQVVMEDEILRRKSVSFADEDQMRLPSRCSTAATDLMDVYPFTVIPEMGTVGVGKKQNFTVKFAPLDMQDYEGRLICRYVQIRSDPNFMALLTRICYALPWSIAICTLQGPLSTYLY